MQPLSVASPNLSFNTSGSGVVNVNNVATGPVALANSASGLGFSLTTTGPLTVNAITTNAAPSASNASISVIDKTGAIVVTQGVTIKANGGSVLLQDNDIKAGLILVGSNATIWGSSTVDGVGNVVLNIGSKVDQVAGTQAPNIISNITVPGAIFYGKNGITSLAPNNTLNASGRNIVFDTDGSSGTIQLDGGVTITADPPAGSVSQTALINATTLAPVMNIPNSVINASAVPALPQAVISNVINTSAPNNFGSSENLQQSPSTLAGIQNTFVRPLAPTISSSAAQPLLGNIRTSEDGSIAADRYEEKNQQALILKDGNLLVAPQLHAAEITTAYGTVKVAPKAVVLVMAFGHGIGVFDLDDRSHGAVSVIVDGRKLILTPGKHCFITGQDVRTFDDVNPGQNLSYRHVGRHELGNGLTAFSAEFHLPSAIHSVKTLRELLLPNTENSRKQAEHFLKTSAILMQLTGGGEPFQKRCPAGTLSMLP